MKPARPCRTCGSPLLLTAPARRAEDGVEALDDFMRSNRFNAIQGND